MITVARYCLIIAYLGSLDSSRDFAGGCGMDFVSYPHLIFLISSQTFEITVAHENFWELNGLSSHQEKKWHKFSTSVWSNQARGEKGNVWSRRLYELCDGDAPTIVYSMVDGVRPAMPPLQSEWVVLENHEIYLADQNEINSTFTEVSSSLSSMLLLENHRKRRVGYGHAKW